jgi:hypothetical protein
MPTITFKYRNNWGKTKFSIGPDKDSTFIEILNNVENVFYEFTESKKKDSQNKLHKYIFYIIKFQ